MNRKKCEKLVFKCLALAIDLETKFIEIKTTYIGISLKKIAKKCRYLIFLVSADLVIISSKY